MAAYASFKDAHKGTTLNASDSLNIQANTTADKHIDFSVRGINTSELRLYYPNVTTLNINWTVPLTSEYHFTFNSTNLFTYKDATLLVTKHWTETVYTDAVVSSPALPIEAAYVGIVLVIAVIRITVYEVGKKEKVMPANPLI